MLMRFLGFLLLIQCTAVCAQVTVTDSSVVIAVAGACTMCKERIEEASKGKGVINARWNMPRQQLLLRYNPSLTTKEKIVNRIVASGHDADGLFADDAVYNALPVCCLYRKMKPAPDSSHINNHQSTQLPVKGVVLEETGKGNFTPLIGATVQWMQSGKSVLSDSNGVFQIDSDSSHSLIISYAGYRADTIAVVMKENLMIILAKGKQLREVVITAKQRSTYLAAANPIRTQIMTEKELFKAACCNLSESFETNPSVDVSYNDAVTGSKQIQLLGLSGNYTQLTVENLPGPRGLATPMGLNTIAGPWIESIQLTKGTGSVANGFESIAGQINIELKKPDKGEKLYFNFYRNNMNKTDVNLNLSLSAGKKWSTTLLLHGDFLYNKEVDFNKDGFRDLPTGTLWSGINRWKYEDGKGWIIQFGFKALTDDKTGGTVLFDATKHKGGTAEYGLGIRTTRMEVFAKSGYVFPEKKYKSIGLQLSAFDHQQDSYFGLTAYEARQKNFYGNLIYQSIIGTTFHKFRTGASWVYDRYNEQFNQLTFTRNESVPGAFFEYTYDPAKKVVLVAGLRLDHNNLFGWFASPRLHLKYEPAKGTSFRLSAGRGQRTANILAENTGVFVSARQLQIIQSTNGKAYGLLPEIAWNKGISYDQQLRLFNRKASLALDFFRNDFGQQVVVDMEDARSIRFYNLSGKSYSNSFQAELNFQPLLNFEWRIAYRYFDIKTTYSNQLLQKPLTALHRAFANLAYEYKGWKLDYTFNYNGRKRIPSTAINPPPYQRASYSPSYILMNAQVSKELGKKYPFELYLGGENLGNYFQQDVIIAPDDAFGQYFDASLVWGPVIGRMIYGGLRFKLK
jgi:outer membrane receptor for ferrienterochelin and colicin